MEIPSNITLDLQQSQQTLEQCLKATYNLTGTIYTNICDSTTYFIPNGSLDFLGIIAVFGLVALMIFAFYKMCTY